MSKAFTKKNLILAARVEDGRWVKVAILRRCNRMMAWLRAEPKARKAGLPVSAVMSAIDHLYSEPACVGVTHEAFRVDFF